MVTEYNKNIIMRRRMEAEKAAALLAASAPSEQKKTAVEEKPVEVKAADKPKKTDAEKLKKKKA